MVRCHAGAAKGCVMSPLLFNMFFAAVIHVILVRFSDDKEIVRDLFHLEGAVAVNKVSMACVRMEFWGMLYADDAGIVSRSTEGLSKMMAVTVTAFEAAGLTVSEKKTETMLLRTPGQKSDPGERWQNTLRSTAGSSKLED